MALLADFIRGFNVGIEFPGGGVYVVLQIGILRLMLVHSEVARYLTSTEEE